MSTLDHLTKGRIGWNIVTGYLDSAARGMGMAKQVAHDARYDVAEDYVQATYKLWEASWEDGAVLRDRQGRRFADASKIHRILHEGPHFKVDAIHLCEPSPQRTPVLFQAGASKRGRDSPPATLNASSSTAPRRRSSAISSPICGPAPPQPAEAHAISSFSP